MTEIPPFIQYGALGILALVLTWVGKRIVDRMDVRFDGLEKKMEEERASNVKLGKMILIAAFKFKNPTANISDEAEQLLHDDDKEK
jgi:hypothetical protein